MRRNPSHTMHGRGVTKPEDKWFSRCIRHRDNWTCRNCFVDCIADQGRLQCCHIYGRANKSTRWHPDNCVALCRECHARFTAEPIEWFEFCHGLLGHEHMAMLRIRKNKVLKTTAQLRKEISDHYRLEYRRMIDQRSFDLRPWE